MFQSDQKNVLNNNKHITQTNKLKSCINYPFKDIVLFIISHCVAAISFFAEFLLILNT